MKPSEMFLKDHRIELYGLVILLVIQQLFFLIYRFQLDEWSRYLILTFLLLIFLFSFSLVRESQLKRGITFSRLLGIISLKTRFDLLWMMGAAILGTLLAVGYWELFASSSFSWEFSIFLLLLVVLVSSVEELWFRGIIHGSIIFLNITSLEKSNDMGSDMATENLRVNSRLILELVAISVGTISFLVYHFLSRSSVNLLLIFLGGIILGAERTASKSMIPPLLTHVIYNILVLDAIF